MIFESLFLQEKQAICAMIFRKASEVVLGTEENFYQECSTFSEIRPVVFNED